jgi:hypothetical protein
MTQTTLKQHETPTSDKTLSDIQALTPRKDQPVSSARRLLRLRRRLFLEAVATPYVPRLVECRSLAQRSFSEDSKESCGTLEMSDGSITSIEDEE